VAAADLQLPSRLEQFKYKRSHKNTENICKSGHSMVALVVRTLQAG
jgi:hypothetical protein